MGEVEVGRGVAMWWQVGLGGTRWELVGYVGSGGARWGR